jgi:hypothetical protein
MMTRYRVCTRYRYRYRVTYDMSRYRVKGKTRYRDTQPDIVSLGDPISGKNPISGMARFQMLRRLWISSISFRKTCRTRQGKWESGISRRLTAFCTRSVRSCCGETQITHLVKLQR